MLSRRTVCALLAGSVSAPALSLAQGSAVKTAFYSGVWSDLTRYDIDFDAMTLARRSTVKLPGGIQYAWPHPSQRFLYVTTSTGGPGMSGNSHHACAFGADASGNLTPHGEPLALRSRPIHHSVDRSGQFLLVAYNDPSGVSVHRIKPDGMIGEEIKQPEKLDFGIYGHQILATPSNQSLILVARGNNATAKAPEDPGALKVYGFKDGVLSNKASVAPGTGLGFGPRHLDFHPTRPWVYVSVERQNKLRCS
jgi:6-phosphogluconolactonase